jgi:hypothetical protein
MITGFIAPPSYSSYASTSKAVTSQLITTANAKSVDITKLPGTSDRAQSLIDSLVKTNAGRQESVQGFASKLKYDQNAVQRISSVIENLPPQTTQKERDAWNAQLASAKNEVVAPQSEISRFQSALNHDPSTEMALKFAGNLLGMSSDEVHKLYNDRADALATSKASAAADGPSSAGSAGGAYDRSDLEMWGYEPSGVRSEIKVNGVVVGRVYNSGVTVLQDEYGSLGQQLGFGGPGEADLEGPQLADYRIAQLKDALKNSNVEITTMSTAMTQAEWLASQTSGNRRVDRSA